MSASENVMAQALLDYSSEVAPGTEQELRRKASATEKRGRVAQTPASVGDAARAADAAANMVNPAHPVRR